jgi:hypothetical protein
MLVRVFNFVYQQNNGNVPFWVVIVSELKSIKELKNIQLLQSTGSHQLIPRPPKKKSAAIGGSTVVSVNPQNNGSQRSNCSSPWQSDIKNASWVIHDLPPLSSQAKLRVIITHTKLIFTLIHYLHVILLYIVMPGVGSSRLGVNYDE